MKRFGRRFRGRRRTVAWIDGLSGMTANPSQARTLAFSLLAGSTSAYAAAVQLTTDADLQMHGGEDVVVTRIVGRLLAYGGRVTVAAPVAASLFARMLVHQSDVTAVSSIAPVDYTLGAGLGRDDILWSRDVRISGTTIVGNGTAAATETSTLTNDWVDVDIRAQRKLQQGRHLFFDIQLQPAGGGAGNVPVDCLLAGSLRMLVKRPK